MKKNDLAIAIIKEFTGDNGCKLSKSQLGKILHERFPSEFKNAEEGRKAVRCATGANGVYHRKYYKEQVEWKGLVLPKPEKNAYSKFAIRETRIGILSDIHFPYYAKPQLDIAIKHLKDWEPEAILLNGDIIDCYQLSSWEKDPSKRSFKYELDMLRSFFEQMVKLFPNTRIIFKLGNHEERYEKIILQRVPEFVEVEHFQFKEVIKSAEYGIEVVDNKRTIKAGKVNIVHGHELPRGIAAPVNPARGFYLKCKSNVIGGHHHQTSEHFESDINEQVTGAWSSGCLCELHPSYMPINKWNHGFITLENYGSEFTVNNKKIINGRVL